MGYILFHVIRRSVARLAACNLFLRHANNSAFCLRVFVPATFVRALLNGLSHRRESIVSATVARAVIRCLELFCCFVLLKNEPVALRGQLGFSISHSLVVLSIALSLRMCLLCLVPMSCH